MADGTTNFVHGFPYACISLGLIDQRVPVLGVIYNPFLEQLYTGVRGAGSFLHTRISPTTPSSLTPPQRLPLAPSSARPLPALAGALLAVEWGSDRAREAIRRKSDSFSRLAGAPPYGVMAHSLRSVGSAALNFALVAQGALDMYWCVLHRCIISFSFQSAIRGANSAAGYREIGCWCVSFSYQC
jgi:myo-inositol-1(or 4)-monophosphatase